MDFGEMIKLVKKYNYIYLDYHIDSPWMIPFGIGDLLILCAQQDSLDKSPYIINLGFFESVFFEGFPSGWLELRLRLLSLFFDDSRQKFIFVKSTSGRIDQSLVTISPSNKEHVLSRIESLNPSITTPSKYIVLHTKCRNVDTDFDQYLQKFLVEYLKNYKGIPILILGERVFKKTFESTEHSIRSCYPMLMETLKDTSNELPESFIDMTLPELYFSSDYDNLVNDMTIIRNAEANIVFGLGGNFCMSLLFSKKTFFHATDSSNISTECLSDIGVHCNFSSKDFFIDLRSFLDSC